MNNTLTRYKLSQLIEVSRGQSLAGEFYAEQGDVMRLTLANFDYQNGGFKEDVQKSDIYYTGTVKPQCLLNEGDIITPLTEQTPGLLGSTARIPVSGKYIQSGDVALVKCNEDLIDPSFCYYLLPSSQIKKQLAAGSQQTKIRHTSPDAIKNCIVDIPCLEQQKKIGNLLDAITAKIDENRKQNDFLEKMAKQLYDYWFVQFDFPDENGRPYRSSGGAMVYNEQLKREIPENWTDTTLGEVCNLYQPRTIGGNELIADGKYRVYGANGIIGRYNEYNHELSEVAMACRGNSCGQLNRTLPFAWITGNAMVLAMKDAEISNEFVAQSCRYMNIQGAITGSGQPQLTKENLQKVKMLQPAKSVLLKFSTAITTIVEIQIHNMEEIDELLYQRQTLLPLLMTGQVKLK